MADISQISVNGISYDIKDATARQSCNDNATAISNKVDKVSGKGLSTNDFTTAYKSQLDSLEATYAKKSDISDVYHYKGSVDTFSDLPNNPTEGDVYNIKEADADNNINEGDNVAWVAANGGTPGHWDNLAGIVRLPTMTVQGTTLVLNS